MPDPQIPLTSGVADFGALQAIVAKIGPVAVTATGTANAITGTSGRSYNTGALQAVFRMLVATTNTSAVTLALDGGTTYSLLDNSGEALTAGDLVAGTVLDFVFDGSAYRVVNHLPGLVQQAEDARDAAATSATAASASQAAAAASAATASTAAADAGTARDQAEIAAIAAGAPLYASIAAGLVATPSGDVFLVQTGPGTAVYENDGGSEVFVGWIGELLYDDAAAVLASTDTGFSTGQIIRTRKKGVAYEVAAPAATDHHLTMAGGDKLYVLRGVGGYNVTAFGAVADGGTDDTAALQRAINATLNDGAGTLLFPAGHYYCAGDLYLCYDATNNTGAPSNALENGRLRIVGEGQMTRFDYRDGRYPGTVIRFASTKQLVTSVEGAARGWKRHISDLSIIGSHSTIVSAPYEALQYLWERVFVGTDSASGTDPVFLISDNYLGKLFQVEVVGDKTLPAVGTAGVGLRLLPSDTAGGGAVFEQVTVGYAATAIEFGRQYDSAKRLAGDFAKSTTFLQCQTQFSGVGYHIRHGVYGVDFLGGWSEYCDAPIKVSDSAQNVMIRNMNLGIRPEQIGERGLIVVGDDTGTAGRDAAHDVHIFGCNLFCTAGIAGVFLYDGARDVIVQKCAFRNGGGAAVGVQGGVGGEVSLRDNQYEVYEENTVGGGLVGAITITRRVCTLGGTFGSPSYTDAAYFALELDFKPQPLAADLDCSGWRRPPRSVAFNTLSATRALTLPVLSSAGGRLAQVTVYKPNSANTVTIDAQTGNTIKGAQTADLTSAYTALSLVHRGSGSTQWDVFGAA